MVLAELGAKLGSALRKVTHSQKIDKDFLKEVLNEISMALLTADVNFKHVAKLKSAVETQVLLQLKDDKGSQQHIKKLIRQTVVDQLIQMLNAEKEPYEFKRGKPQVVMFVGLQGAGKTTTCTKYAYHYIKRGWRTALVCCDTFRAGAFNQLQQNAAKIRCPFYGNPDETDPVKIADEGVEIFKKEKYEIIIVDTSGRHSQEESLFDEMKQIKEVTKPNEIVFVMDGSIG